jgi:transcriptional regulator with XRE-family HTH domain
MSENEKKIIDKKSLNCIKEIRVTKDLTLKDVSKKSGLKESTINRIENGTRIPNHITMLKICKGLDVRFEEVFETEWENVKFV